MPELPRWPDPTDGPCTVGLVLGAAAGAAAGLVFRAVWKQASGQADAPTATDEERGWGEILAVLQGAIFA